MKAIVVSEFGNEDVLALRDIPLPEPEDGEIRVRIGAAGVNPVETYIRAGEYATLPSLPFTPGNDGAGIVDKLGRGVERLAPGQRVFVAAALATHHTGTYAEYVVCDADAVHPLPESLSYPQGAGLGTPGLAAANALFGKALLRPGETALIHGATGGVGTIAVQLARQAGARVFATAGSAEGAATINALGAHRVFRHDQDNYVQEIKNAAPSGPDVILEVLANRNLVKDLAMLGTRGRIIVVGNRGRLDFNPRDAMSKDAAIHGMLLNNMTRTAYVENMYRLSAALENGLRVVVEQELPLERAPEAHRMVTGGNKTGKIVLTTQPL